jgi:thioredoxin-related protein
MLKTVCALILAVTLSGAEWLVNFDNAKALAMRDSRFILLNFSGSDWCGPCIKMKKEVFESEAFISIAETQLVLLRADFPRSKKNQLSKEQTAHNETLAERYNPDGKFPFTLLLDSNGNVVKKWDGYVFSTQDVFITDLKNTIDLSKK